MHRKPVLGTLSLFLILLLAACSNPAADKPAAEVSEPVAETAPAPAADSGVTYAFSNEGSSVGFIGSKVTGSHEGGFNSFEGEFNVADGTVESSSVTVSIDTTSMWSDNDQLTDHLKSDDFFAVEKFPTASFTSSSIAPLEGEEGSHTVTGNLELHGVTKQISFPATVALTDGGFTANAEFSIMRFDFGLEYAGRADDLIRDEVVIKLDLKGGDGDSMTEGGAGDAADGGEAETGSDDTQAH